MKVEKFAQEVKRARHLFVQSFGLILGDFAVDLWMSTDDRTFTDTVDPVWLELHYWT